MLCAFCKTNDCAVKKNGGFKQYCSSSCQSKHTIEKRNATNLKKYGTTNPMLLPDIKDKRDKTNIKRFGVKNPFSLTEIQQKHKNTCIERFGVEYASQSPLVQEKMKSAWKKYSGNHPFSDSVCREKRTKTLLEKYGVEHPIQYKPIKDKIEETCVKLYGSTNPSETDIVKQKILATRTHGNISFLKNKSWMEQHIEDLGIRGVAELLNLSARYIRSHADLLKIPFRKSKHRSEFENQIVCLIRQWLPKAIIIQNDKTLIGRELDIYLPEYKLAIECNGTYWHSELNGRGRSFHLEKTKLCIENGIHLIHIWEHQWFFKKELIMSRIKSLLKLNNTIYARKCRVFSISSKDAISFLQDNHIQGSCSSSIRLGLFLNDQLVSVMTFGKSRFSKGITYELLRFCNIINYNVVGGGSKLFSNFVKTYLPSQVISYSDKSFNRGLLYQTLGFKYSHSSPPSYHYTKNYSVVENRIRFQKHKLSSILPIFDQDKSEWDNMQDNGYDRIWDCGNDVWIYPRN